MSEKQRKTRVHTHIMQKSEFIIHIYICGVCVCVCVMAMTMMIRGPEVVRATPRWDARQCMHTARKISISNSPNRKNSTAYFLARNSRQSLHLMKSKRKTTKKTVGVHGNARTHGMRSHCVCVCVCVPYHTLCMQNGFCLISSFSIFLTNQTQRKNQQQNITRSKFFFT